jgi:hypothetical protein
MSTHKQSPRHEPLTLRMLGDNITLTRDQWRQLAAMLVPVNPYDARDAANLSARIDELVSSS